MTGNEASNGTSFARHCYDQMSLANRSDSGGATPRSVEDTRRQTGWVLNEDHTQVF